VSNKQVNTCATEVCGLARYDTASLGVSGSFLEKRLLWCQGYV